MLTQAKLDRLNVLAQKGKEGCLSPNELSEQKALREEYVHSFRRRVAADLESKGMRPQPKQGCNCGCRLKH